ncbi:hypothetical protein ACFP65_09025 [Marinilactibacillus sp. GCM10026970]|uniref:hypothetical protein n=1 Tax=Marinilactibacillus sp. GCM10026970 TaxID=3252642 RepID=UPI00361524A0
MILLSVFLLLAAAILFWIGYQYKDDPKGTRPNGSMTPLGKIKDRENYQKWEGRFYFIYGAYLFLVVLSVGMTSVFDWNPIWLRFWIVLMVVLSSIRIMIMSKFIEFRWKTKNKDN